VQLVAVLDGSTIVVTDPSTRLPMPVQLGSLLHDGSRLLAADPLAGTARTDKNMLRLE
jgi:hypothetical protein